MKLIDKIIAEKKAAATANKAVKSSAATKIAIGTALAEECVCECHVASV